MSATLRVVLIDDDPDLRKLIKITLEFTAGWEVVDAADGVDGIATVQREKPDVVLLDVMMPGMDGYEVCRRLKQGPDTASIPVVLLTARKHVDDERAGTAGAAGVVFKPFEPDELAPRIGEILGGPNG